MQGNEFCRAIRDNRATETIPLLVLTDDTQTDAEKYVLDCGADDYVAKSRDSDILLARIDLLLRRSREAPVAPIDEASFYKAQRVLLVDDSPTYLAFLEDELGARAIASFPRRTEGPLSRSRRKARSIAPSSIWSCPAWTASSSAGNWSRCASPGARCRC